MLPPFEYAITMLMSRQMPQNVRLHPEQRLSVDLAEAMRAHTAAGRYKGVWFCVQNEAKRHRITAMIQKAMGLIPGVTDFVFVWEGGALFVELKAGSNKQTESQRFFAVWCRQARLTYVLCRSVAEVEATLRNLKALA